MAESDVLTVSKQRVRDVVAEYTDGAKAWSIQTLLRKLFPEAFDDERPKYLPIRNWWGSEAHVGALQFNEAGLRHFELQSPPDDYEWVIEFGMGKQPVSQRLVLRRKETP